MSSGGCGRVEGRVEGRGGRVGGFDGWGWQGGFWFGREGEEGLRGILESERMSVYVCELGPERRRGKEGKEKEEVELTFFVRGSLRSLSSFSLFFFSFSAFSFLDFSSSSAILIFSISPFLRYFLRAGPDEEEEEAEAEGLSS